MPSTGAIRQGRAYIEVSALDITAKGLSSAERRMKVFAATAKALGAKFFKGGLASMVPFAAAERVYSSFSDRVAELREVSRATSAELKKMVDQANTLGTPLGIAPTQVISAQIELAKGGAKPADIQKITADVLDFKTAAGEEVSVADATRIGLDTLAQFGLEMSQLPRVADAYVAAANASTTSVYELAEGMKYAAPAAALAGENIERTAAALAVLAQKGVKGEQGGTALRNAYIRLADAGNRADLKKLTGVSATDAKGNLKPMAGLLVEIGNALSSMPSADRLSVLDVVFGERALFAATALGQGNTAFKEMLSEIEGQAGIAKRIASGMADSIGGDGRRIQAELGAIANTVGIGLDTPLRDLAKRFSGVLAEVRKFISANPELTRTAAASAIALTVLGATLWTVGAASQVAAYGFTPLIGGTRLLSRGVGLALAPLRLMRGALGATFAMKAAKLPFAGLFKAAAPAARLFGSAVRLAAGPLVMLGGVGVGGLGGITRSLFRAAGGANVLGKVALAATWPLGMIGWSAGFAAKHTISAFKEAGGILAPMFPRLASVARSSFGVMKDGALGAASAARGGFKLFAGVGRTSIGKTSRAVWGLMSGTKSLGRSIVEAGAKMTRLGAGGLMKAAKGGVMGGGKAALSGIASVAGAVLSPTGLLVAGAAALTAGIVYATGGIDTLRGGVSALGQIGSQAFPQIAGAAKNAWGAVSQDGAVAFTTIQQQIAAGDWMGALSTGVTGLKTIWADVVAEFAPIWAPIAVMLEDGWSAGVEGMKSVWGTLTKWFEPASQMLSSAWKGVMDYFGLSNDSTTGKVRVTMSDMVYGIQSVFLNLKTTVLKVWNSIKSVGIKLWGEIGETATRSIGKLAKLLVNIPGIAKLLGTDAESLSKEIDAMTEEKVKALPDQQKKMEEENKKERDDIDKMKADGDKKAWEAKEKRDADWAKREQDKIDNAKADQQNAQKELAETARLSNLSAAEGAVNSAANDLSAVDAEPDGAPKDLKKLQIAEDLLKKRQEYAKLLEQERQIAVERMQGVQTGNPEQIALEARIKDIEAKQKALVEATAPEDRASLNRSQVQAVLDRLGVGPHVKPNNTGSTATQAQKDAELKRIRGGRGRETIDPAAGGVAIRGAGIGRLSPAAEKALQGFGMRSSDLKFAETTARGTFSARAAAGTAGASFGTKLQELTQKIATSNEQIATNTGEMAKQQPAVAGE